MPTLCCSSLKGLKWLAMLGGKPKSHPTISAAEMPALHGSLRSEDYICRLEYVLLSSSSEIAFWAQKVTMGLRSSSVLREMALAPSLTGGTQLKEQRQTKHTQRSCEAAAVALKQAAGNCHCCLVAVTLGSQARISKYLMGHLLSCKLPLLRMFHGLSMPCLGPCSTSG